MQKKTLTLSLIFASIICSNSVLAESSKPQVVSKENTSNDAATYWTADRLQNAKPFPLPQIDPRAFNRKDAANVTSEKSVSVEAMRPTVSVEPDNKPLFKSTATEETSTPLPADFGNKNEQFSSSGLIPMSADQTYPYTTVGRLYFYQPGKGDMYCTAAVIRKRIIVTAGHCLHSGNGQQSGFYDKFAFYPAYRDGSAPYSSWGWSWVTVSSSWFSSGGTIPNSADYGMIELSDNSRGKVGDVTGTLGYKTQALMPNHAHIIGYSSNFDGGTRMHQVTAQSAFKDSSNNNVEFGSDMDKGSSGSPLIQNFGGSGKGGNNPGASQLIGVIAWGYTATNALAEGASIPDNRFTDLVDKACAHKSGNC